jgi:hypothetical protein
MTRMLPYASGHQWVGLGTAMFVFFSNRLGCLGSLLVSVVLTVILLVVLNVL